MVRAYELLAEQCDYPLHLGVTEAGPAFQGTIKSAVAFGALLSRGHRRHHPGVAVGAAGRGGQGRPADPGVAEPAPAPAGDRVLPVLRPRPGRRLLPGREGHRRPGRRRGAAAGRGDGLRGERSRRGPGGRPGRGQRQRQGPDLRPRRGHQDRPGVPDRRDPDRGGAADGRARCTPTACPPASPRSRSARSATTPQSAEIGWPPGRDGTLAAVDIEIRPATAQADYREIASRVDGISFGATNTEQDFADTLRRSTAAFTWWPSDGDRFVGVAGDYRFKHDRARWRDAVPGVTWVSVLPTHRRRGVLRALMQHQLDRYREQATPAAVLTASEGGIYRRFGFGPSTTERQGRIDRRSVRLRRPVDTAEVSSCPPRWPEPDCPSCIGRWRAADPGRAEPDRVLVGLPVPRSRVAPARHDREVLPGAPGRLPRLPGRTRLGQTACRQPCVITTTVRSPGRARRAVAGAARDGPVQHASRAGSCRVDDPLPFLLNDPRQLRTWPARTACGCGRSSVPRAARPPAATAVEIEAVIEVDGERVRLAGGPAGAECVPTDRPAAWPVRPGRAGLGVPGQPPAEHAAPGRAGCAATTGAAGPARPGLLHRPGGQPRHRVLSRRGRPAAGPARPGSFQGMTVIADPAADAARRRRASPVRSLVAGDPVLQLRAGRPAAARARSEPAPARRLPVGAADAERRRASCGRRRSTAAT